MTKSDGTPYKVFTPFYSAWHAHGWRAPAKTGPKSARWIDPADVNGGVDIPDAGIERELPAGEAAARTAWKRFVESTLSDYEDDRNRPDRDGISRMSAHLKFGTIHPGTMAADLGGGKGAQAYLRELAFRDFYAGMRQLAETGFMHNRVRMIVASFLVKDLHLPWQWGARWFLDQPVDGDMASNQHGWQWAAGCGTDAAPYFRVFNPDTPGPQVRSRRGLRAPPGARVRRRRVSRADGRARRRTRRGAPAVWRDPLSTTNRHMPE